MPFSSAHFLLLLPCLVAVFWALPPRGQRHWLLLSSFIVYIYAGWTDLGLLVGITSANWLATRPPRSRPRVCYAMVGVDLLFLAWFKYRYFLAGLGGPAHQLLIPLGISFYVFQLISYQVELAKGILDRVPSFYSFFLYICFFPHHQAGPIMRPHAFILCFDRPRTWVPARLKIGLALLIWGLFKKVWIADLIAPQVDRAFAAFHGSGGAHGNLVRLAVLYGIQIYGDFSGYSDMAVGLGRLFGFKLERNFHQPYVARNAPEFWGRWHVTLSQWLREHVYIPLGGNRRGRGRTLLNLLLVMLVGGLWHGAAWTFVLWGGMHGLYLVIQRLLPPAGGSGPGRLLSRLGFQVLVMLTWLPFRETSIRALLAGARRWDGWIGPELVPAALLFAAILLFSHAENWAERQFPRFIRWADRAPGPALALATSGCLYLVLMGAGRAVTFIYQRF